MKRTKEYNMVDFREYLQVEDYLLEENDDIIFNNNEFDGEFDAFQYFESPFKPIDIGDYILYLFASEQNLCSPAISTLDKYSYDAWEVSIEKFHPKYGYVVCSSEIMNELGYNEFGPTDYYIAYTPVDLVQQIFEHILNKLKLPI